MTAKVTYLGDGLYVSFDGHQVVLYTKRRDGIHFVCLDHEILEGFLNYLKHEVVTNNSGKIRELKVSQ